MTRLLPEIDIVKIEFRAPHPQTDETMPRRPVLPATDGRAGRRTRSVTPALPPRLPRTKKTAYHHGDLRQALLDAAESILEESGVESLTLRECARRAGVSHGAPAHHFGDVTGLLTELSAICFERFGARLTAARAAAPPVPFEQLLAIGLAYVDFALRHPAHFRLMFRTERLRPTQRMHTADHASYRVLRECIAATDSAAGGGGRLLEEKAAVAHALVHGFATLVLEAAGYEDNLRAHPDRARELLERMLRVSRPAFEMAALAPSDAAGST